MSVNPETELMIQACKDLDYRRAYGHWKDKKIPISIIDIGIFRKNLFFEEDDHSWILIVEHIVYIWAVKYMAEHS